MSVDPELAAAGQAIRDWRAERSMTQKSLAKEADINQPRLSVLERGYYPPKKEELRRLAAAGAPTAAFVKALPEPAPEPEPEEHACGRDDPMDDCPRCGVDPETEATPQGGPLVSSEEFTAFAKLLGTLGVQEITIRMR